MKPIMPTSGRTPKETHGLLGDLLPDLDRGSVQAVDSARCDGAAADAAMHSVPTVFLHFLIK